MSVNEENTTDVETKRSSLKKYLVRAVKFLLAVTVIYFAGQQLVSNWAEVSGYQWTLDPPMLALSVVLHLLTFALFSKVWCLLIRAFGFDVPLRHGFKIAYIANLGRYIPGKFWPVIGMIYLLKKIRIDMETAFASWGVATLLGLPPAFLVGFITFYFFPDMLSGIWGDNLGVGPLLAVIATFGASGFLVFAPDRTMALFNWVIGLLRRPPVQFKLSRKTAMQVYGGYFVCWVCYGLAFYTFVNGVMAEPGIPLAAGIGAFVTAYLIGYLFVFSPGGLGAREWVLIAVLTPFLGPIASGLAVAARIWNLVVELIAFAIALAIKLDSRKD
ncbi:MAG: flippase-like domain-containing protein [candidate division Zixibacteria bacterium]|nr:flippase-like domain-containing protein [candidate division Zixibacteria bacterium]